MPIYNLACNGCGTSVDVGHPDPAHPLYDPDALAKLAAPDAAVQCPPDSGCCAEPHDHAAAANSCPGDHGDCPAGDDCSVVTPVGEACPGGHCHVDLPDCTVCRPLTITAFEGAAVLGGQGL